MAGIGLSRQISGAVDGYNQVEARRDRETSRQRSEAQWDQGQEDRNYKLQRRGVTDARADEEYQKQKDAQDQFDDVGDVMRNWMMTGDYDPVAEAMTKYTGMEISFDKKPDGSVYMNTEGMPEPKKVSTDDVGLGLQMLKSKKDMFGVIAAKEKSDAAKKEKTGDRKHDMAKIRAEGDQKIRLEREKQKGSGGSSESSKAKLAKSKHQLSIEKELNDIAVQDYGSLFGDQWKFDTTRDKSMRSAQADLATSIYFSSDNPKTNSASREALQKMRELLVEATQEADAALDEGRIDKKDYDNAVADLIDEKVSAEIKSMTPPPGQTLQRDGEQAEPKSSRDEDITLGNANKLKEMAENATPEELKELKAHFDKTEGREGAADEILKDGFGGETSKAKSGVNEGSVSLIRDANAAEVKQEKAEPKKKYDMSGVKARKESRKSMKANSKTAVSEYKNEWKTMDDEGKAEWLKENGKALKYASPRSYKKADKEVRDIRNKARFSKKGMEEYRLMREKRKE